MNLPVEDTGRMGFREPDEAPDGRPMISRRPFYRDMTEQLTYQNAVEANPRKPGEAPGAYIVRIAELVAGMHLPAAVKPMPEARLPYKDADDVLMRLREQADLISERKAG